MIVTFEPVNDAGMSRDMLKIVISVALEGEGSHKAYSMTILDDSKRLVWKRGGLKPDRDDSLSVEFHSTFFRQGHYTLTVDGVAGDGSTSVVGEYSFRVLKTP